MLFDHPTLPADWRTQISQLSADWQAVLRQNTAQAALDQVAAFITKEQGAGHRIYPPTPFAALASTPLASVKVVILGQDPYHGPEQAQGLSFSVPTGIRPPPSLKNIQKEIQREFGGALPVHGNLQAWAAQGVLLLNTVLTVREKQAGSHRQQGWEHLTDLLLAALANQPCVFMLWGADAQQKSPQLQSPQHLVLQAPHPSPLSAYRGFIGCGHFGAANDYLRGHGLAPIDWMAL